ncbi:MAG: DNA repair protein RecO [Enterobacterales bacterium]|nr:DNA repair protein RecO [Enterobacterales bacterium]
MNKDKITCYLLHSRPFKETSLITHLFSCERGRLSLLAKGVKRKSAQGLRAVLQPFSLLEIEYVGRSDLKTLCQVEVLQSWSSVSNRVLACGYYLNELIMRATEEWQESEELFNCYRQSLGQLQVLGEQQNIELAKVLRNFEVTLLTQLGLAPDWEKDIVQADIVANGFYHYIVDEGFSPVASEINMDDKNQVATNQPRWIGEAILSLSSGEYKPEMLQSCKRLTQHLLLPVIGDKPITSRKMWL